MAQVIFILGVVVIGAIIAVTYKRHLSVDRDIATHADRLHHDIAE